MPELETSICDNSDQRSDDIEEEIDEIEIDTDVQHMSIDDTLREHELRITFKCRDIEPGVFYFRINTFITEYRKRFLESPTISAAKRTNSYYFDHANINFLTVF